jgi:hypothetical protein
MSTPGGNALVTIIHDGTVITLHYKPGTLSLFEKSSNLYRTQCRAGDRCAAAIGLDRRVQYRAVIRVPDQECIT